VAFHSEGTSSLSEEKQEMKTFELKENGVWIKLADNQLHPAGCRQEVGPRRTDTPFVRRYGLFDVLLARGNSFIIT
jgi:hypothetical protein